MECFRLEPLEHEGFRARPGFSPTYPVSGTLTSLYKRLLPSLSPAAAVSRVSPAPPHRHLCPPRPRADRAGARPERRSGGRVCTARAPAEEAAGAGLAAGTPIAEPRAGRSQRRPNCRPAALRRRTPGQAPSPLTRPRPRPRRGRRSPGFRVADPLPPASRRRPRGWREGAGAGDREDGRRGEARRREEGRGRGRSAGRGAGGAGGGARPSRSRGAATRPSLLKTLPLKWGRVFQLKKRSIFFFSKKADEVGKKGKETGTVSAAATDVATVGAKRAAKKGGKEARRQGDNAPVSVGARGAGTGDFGGRPATKENCHRERGGSGGSGAAQVGCGAQLAGGRCPVGGTGRGQRSGNRERLAKWHRWPERLGSWSTERRDWPRPGIAVTPRTRRPAPAPPDPPALRRPLGKPAQEGEDGGGRSGSVSRRKPAPARS